MVLVRHFRPERLGPACNMFAAAVMQLDLGQLLDYNLHQIVTVELSSTTPIALVSVPGHDASYRVEALIAKSGTKCTSVAMGSPEGFAVADKAIGAAARAGYWVLLKNVHLASSWLGHLEKRLHALKPHHTFRLFLTMEANLSIPINILRQARVIMNEPAPGIKANLLDSLKGISTEKISQGPAEKSRLYFLLAWFHSVVQERLRYVPLGWSKSYDFNDSDLSSAFTTIDSWLNDTVKGRANIDPALIPWEALRTLLKQSVYGGRIDSEFDQDILNSFVDKLFTPLAYNVKFQLVRPTPTEEALFIPEVTKLDQFVQWVHTLPEKQPPGWLGLPPDAERLIAAAQGMDVL